jgi:hypothetical protein
MGPDGLSWRFLVAGQHVTHTPLPLQVAEARVSAAQALSEQKRRQEQVLIQLRA